MADIIRVWTNDPATLCNQGNSNWRDVVREGTAAAVLVDALGRCSGYSMMKRLLFRSSGWHVNSCLSDP